MEFKINYKEWNIEEETGYKPLTTCYMDLSIAEPFGNDAIMQTYRALKKGFEGNVKYLTELTMALNWKIYEHYNRNREMAKLYNELYLKMDDYCYNTFKGDDRTYYLRTTD